MGTQALAPPQVVDVTLSLFGGRKTDIAPADCPEGLTPDEQDNIYLPGDVQNRPALARLFNPPLEPGATILYEKTYVQPNNDPLTLILSSSGTLYVEDVGNNAGIATQFGSVPKGLYAQSVSAFGREYIAFSDLLHGQGVPLQYDGTHLDRVTQDGPGAGPTVANFLPAPATLQGAGAGTTATITSVTPSDPHTTTFTIPIFQNGHWTTETITITTYTTLTVLTAAPNPYTQGELVSLTGITPSSFNQSNLAIGTIVDSTHFKVPYSSNSAAGGTGGTVTALAPTLVRSQGIVTANASAAHGFQPGWQVQIFAVTNINLGGGIAAISRDANGIVTVTTTNPHGIPVDTSVAIVGVSNPDASFNGTFPVATVPSPTTFTYLLGGTVENSSAGSGNVQDIFNTTAFIQSVPSTTTFTYAQIGPDDVTNGSGTATIIGQVSPGTHLLGVIFLTRNGALTRPSPPIPFTAAGGQMWALSTIPTGPANVVARLLYASGAGGDNFFTIPVVPQVGGQIVGTSFLIPDNTSTSAIIDFSDNTLFDGIAIDQVGNDLFDQRVLGPVLGFFAYASRLACWGDYQKIENFLNMGFCGGPTGATPLGWTVASAGGLVVAGGSWTAGQSWQITGDGTANPKGQITQPASQDVNGTAIVLPSTSYLLRMWAAVPGGLAPLDPGVITVELYSPSLGSLGSATIPIANLSVAGGFVTAPFSIVTPTQIPGDLVLRVYDLNTNNLRVVLHGEIELVYAQNPYNNTLVHFSYALNEEAFAQTTGNLGAADDDSSVRCLALLRQSTLLETAAGVHIFQDNDFEPDQWVVNQLTRAIGGASLRSGDPGKFGTGDAAEDWALVAGKNGVYLFAGAEFWKVSQEISRGALPYSQDPRPTWDDINWAQLQTIVAKNDPATRRAYFAVPINGALTPNGIFVLDYHEMDTSTQIAASPPLHITIQGKMKSSDLTRKWSFWNVAANDLEILERPGNQRALFFAGGNGQAIGQGAGFGNIYALDPAKLTDDDYGPMNPYYTTFAFVDHDQEQQLQLGSDAHLYKQIHAFVTGVGLLTITPIANSLYNFYPPLSPRILVSDTDSSNFLKDDLEWTCAGLRAARMFFRISVEPLPGATDVQYRVQKFITHMMKDPIAPFRQSGI